MQEASARQHGEAAAAAERLGVAARPRATGGCRRRTRAAAAHVRGAAAAMVRRGRRARAARARGRRRRAMRDGTGAGTVHDCGADATVLLSQRRCLGERGWTGLYSRTWSWLKRRCSCRDVVLFTYRLGCRPCKRCSYDVAAFYMKGDGVSMQTRLGGAPNSARTKRRKVLAQAGSSVP